MRLWMMQQPSQGYELSGGYVCQFTIHKNNPIYGCTNAFVIVPINICTKKLSDNRHLRNLRILRVT